MKKILFILLLSGAFSFTETRAQLSLSLNVNIGTQPLWGPVGYDHVDNYYIPDIETYYNVSSKQYTYMENGRWVTTSSLPARYRNFNLYTAHKVVANESKPWLHNDTYKKKYASFKGKHDQQAIRDSHDNKYFENKDHPRHNEWKKDDHGKKGRG